MIRDWLRNTSQKLLDSTSADERIGRAWNTGRTNLKTGVGNVGQSFSQFFSQPRQSAQIIGNNVNSFFNKPLVQGRPTVSQAIRLTAPTVSQNFGNLYRNSFLPKPLGQMIGNTAQNAGNTVVNAVSGLDKVLTGKPIQGAAQIAKGVGQFYTSKTPLSLTSNILSNVGPSQSRRAFTGVQRGMSIDDTLSPTTQANKSLNLPFIGAVDPLMTAGSMVGFTQNALNKRLYSITNKFIPTSHANAFNWFLTTQGRGGIENIIQTLDQMPDTPREAAKYLASRYGEGAIMELGGQALGEAGKKVLSTKEAISLKKWLNEPVLTKTLIDREAGLNRFTKVPRWKSLVTEINTTLADKFPVGATIRETKNAQSTLSDITSKYGWTANQLDDGTIQLSNRLGKPAATIKVKGDSYSVFDNGGQRIMSGKGKLEQSAEKVMRDYFYAKPNEIKPIATKRTTQDIQQNVNATKQNIQAQNKSVPTEVYHSTPALEIEGGQLRASKSGAMGEGVYLHTNPDTARYAAAMQADGNLADQNVLNIKLKTKNIYKWTENGYPDERQLSVIKKYGHDGVMMPDGEIVVFDPKNIEIINNPNVAQAPEPPKPQSTLGDIEKQYNAFKSMDDKVLVDTIDQLETAGKQYTDTPTYQALRKVYQERGLGNLYDEKVRLDSEKTITTPSVKPTDGFTNDKSPMQSGKIDKTLSAKIRYNGEVMTKREYVKKMVEEGNIIKNGKLYDPRTDGYPVLSKTEQDYAKYLIDTKPNVAQAPVSKSTIKIKPSEKVRVGKTDTSMIEDAINQGDLDAAKAIYDVTDGTKPSFDDLVAKVQTQQDRILKSAQGETDTNQALFEKMGKFIAKNGEKSEGGLLYREHIPGSKFGIPSDELASQMGMSESELMKQLVDEFGTGGDTIKISQLPKIKIEKVKNKVDELQLPKSIKVSRGELGEVTGVSVGGASATPKTIKNRAAEAKADYQAWSRKLFEQSGATNAGAKAVGQATKAVKSGTSSPVSNPEGMRDINGLKAYGRDVYRNFREVYGKNFSRVKELVLDPFDRSKGRMVSDLKQWTDDLNKNVVKKFGITKGSKESAAIQNFGEGKINQAQLENQFGVARAKQIMEADQWFRQAYDNLLEQVNQTRRRIYPNDPTKIIPRRKDYYRHFTELAEGVRGLLNIFDNPANISSALAGTSDFTRPNSKWLSFAQKRLGMKTQEDAVGGFLDYLKAQVYAKNIDPHINTFRSLADEIAANTADGPQAGKMNGFIEYLRDFSDDLSGKTNPIDRPIQKIIGRKTMRVLNWLNSRVKANVILGNVSSSIAQIFNVPQGIANAGIGNSTKGLGRTIGDIFNKNGEIQKSTFVAERYSDDLISQFDSRMIDQPKKMAAWITGVLDRVGTRYIWNSHYERALKDGIKNPIKFADDQTRAMVAGRGIGEVPLVQKSKTFQLIAPFTLEVGNLWHVMGDWVGNKEFGKLATFFLASYVFNQGAKQIRGSDVSFDPIQASIDAYNAYQEEEDKKIGAMRAGGRLAGEVLSNTPLGSKVAEIYPEYGTKIGGETVTRKELFGEGDPTRFGSGLVAQQAFTDPIFKLIPPFGGQQIKRSLEGIQATNKGYSETKSGRVRFATENSPLRNVQRAVFGQYSTPEAREYFDKGRTALGEKQSATVRLAGNKQQAYDEVIDKRELESRVEDAKAALKTSGEKYAKVGDLILIPQSNEDIRTVDPAKFETIKTAPTYTGKKLLDKELYSAYSSDITQRKNDVEAMYKAGLIDATQAESMLTKLETLRKSAKSGSGNSTKAVITAKQLLSEYKKLLNALGQIKSARTSKSLKSYMSKTKYPKIKKMPKVSSMVK